MYGSGLNILYITENCYCCHFDSHTEDITANSRDYETVDQVHYKKNGVPKRFSQRNSKNIGMVLSQPNPTAAVTNEISTEEREQYFYVNDQT